MIGVLNYGGGNLGSVENALKRLGAPFCYVDEASDIDACLSSSSSPSPSSKKFEKIIMPGDGHFGTTMASLNKTHLSQAIKKWINADKPFLGICIGLQVLFESSEEAPGVCGLGIIEGTVKRFPGRKVPQIGWNQTLANPSPKKKLFDGTPENSFFYYIHSYYAAAKNNDDVCGTAEYYLKYCAAVERGNLAAVQFHPEKSGTEGIALLERWVN
ncbi:MAG: imidazole glycerol phosphate synthase subunit HisH [Termitinemataceae bacterium]|nr:MAG: imidazole glycerol phosphate synthase subunit HisH [Termitinemataceae bacterium]